MSERFADVREALYQNVRQSTSERYADLREALYLLSTELIILYVLAFGLLALKTDNMFAAGMGYAAVLCTSLLAYVLPALALLLAALGFEHEHKAAVAGARGGAVFMCAAVLMLLVLTTSLWSSPLVCVYVNESSTQCYMKGDSAWQDTDAAEARFVFPSRAQYLEYTDLANATEADVFLKTSLSENDYVTKLHAVVAMPVVFIIFVLQNSFFYTIYSVHTDKTNDNTDKTNDNETQDDTYSGADVCSLFVRCAVLLLCIVVDSADIFSAWNVSDVGPQMLPSLVFTSVLMIADFSATVIDNQTQNLTHGVMLAACIAGMLMSALYTTVAVIVACHYVVGGFAPLHDFITDTRLTTVHILFTVFMLLDACSVCVRSALKIYKYYQSPGDIKQIPKQVRAETGVSEKAFHSDNIENLDMTPKKNR
jgi:hypothetical protein